MLQDKGIGKMPRQMSVANKLKFVALGVTVAWLATLLFLAWFRQSAALVNTFDTGVYLQILYNFAHYGDLASSLTNESNFLAHHFQPLILSFLPFTLGHWQPLGLFLVAALLLGFSALLWWHYLGLMGGNRHGLERLAFLVVFLLTPSLSFRVFYSFTPEILALPSLIYLSFRLSAKDPPLFDVGIILNLVLIGLCKENYWLTAAGFSCAFALRHKDNRVSAALATLLFLLIFAALFFWWMPAHRSELRYYAREFYPFLQLPFLELIQGAVLNFFSSRSLETLCRLFIFQGLGLALLGLKWLWLPLLPGLMQILLSSAPQLHHQANHYGIMVDPIIWQGAWLGWMYIRRYLAKRSLRLTLLTGLCALYFFSAIISDSQSPLYYMQRALTADDKTWHRRRDLSQQLHDAVTPPILAEDFLPPLFPEWQNVHVLLRYPGVAAGPDQAMLDAANTIVTQIDFANFSCQELGQAFLKELPQVEQSSLQQLCSSAKNSFFLAKSFSGINVYKRSTPNNPNHIPLR